MMFAIRHSRRATAAWVLAILFALAPSMTGAQKTARPVPPSKLDRALMQRVEGQRGGRIDVIVRHVPRAGDAMTEAVRSAGGDVRKAHRLIDGFAASVPVGALKRLAARADVRSVSLDAPVQVHAAAPVAGEPGDGVLRQTLGVPADVTGAGVGVAVIDSGAHPSRDFAPRVIAFYDFTGSGRFISATTTGTAPMWPD